MCLGIHYHESRPAHISWLDSSSICFRWLLPITRCAKHLWKIASNQIQSSWCHHCQGGSAQTSLRNSCPNFPIQLGLNHRTKKAVFDTDLFKTSYPFLVAVSFLWCWGVPWLGFTTHQRKEERSLFVIPPCSLINCWCFHGSPSPRPLSRLLPSNIHQQNVDLKSANLSTKNNFWSHIIPRHIHSCVWNTQFDGWNNKDLMVRNLWSKKLEQKNRSRSSCFHSWSYDGHQQVHKHHAAGIHLEATCGSATARRDCDTISNG